MTPIEQNYYEVLGVPRNANAQQIHRAYRTRARQLHPDVSARADAVVRFQELSSAYGVLRDPSQRARYDRAAVKWGVGSPSYPVFTSRPERDDVPRFLDETIRLGPIVIRLSAALRWLS